MLLTRKDAPGTPGVSSHYLVSDQERRVYLLVDETQRAWHAGAGQWFGERDVNSSSIGIENVGWGYTYGIFLPKPPCPQLVPIWSSFIRKQRYLGDRYINMPALRKWHAFPDEQIETLTALGSSILRRWPIQPSMVIGHSDLAIGRKIDPGPLFPWKTLASRGIGMWPDANVDRLYSDRPMGISIPWMQRALGKWGYKISMTGKLDPDTSKVITAFQLHFRPSNFKGQIDLETTERLDQLLCQRRWQEEESERIVG